jgi:predicted O-methyltransferase YrrM
MALRLLLALRKHGPVGALRVAWHLAVDAPRERRARPTAKPTLKELVRSTSTIEVRAEDLLEQFDLEVGPRLSAEADERVGELERRTATRDLIFPERYAVERESARFLYLLVRTTTPELVLETGVANGASTFLILSAMGENGRGRLVSVDVADEVAVLLSPREQDPEVWELRIIEPGGLHEVVDEVVDELGPIDVFLHDSDHSYENVVAEIGTAWPQVRPGGFVLADDGELSYGFLDATQGRAEVVAGLFDRRKLLLAARR